MHTLLPHFPSIIGSSIYSFILYGAVGGSVVAYIANLGNRARGHSHNLERYDGFVSIPFVDQVRAHILRHLVPLVLRTQGPGVAAAPHPELILWVSSCLRAARGRRKHLDLCLRRRYHHDSYSHLLFVSDDLASCTHFFLSFLPS